MRPSPCRFFRLRLPLLLLTLFILAACGGAEGIEATGVWGRASPHTAANGAFYMALRNHGDGDDALTAVMSDACSWTELHESTMDESGVMRMSPVPGGRILLPAGATVTLQPGGIHVMCLELATPLAEGETIPLILQFEQHEPLTVEAEIRLDAP